MEFALHGALFPRTTSGRESFHDFDLEVALPEVTVLGEIQP